MGAVQCLKLDDIPGHVERKVKDPRAKPLGAH